MSATPKGECDVPKSQPPAYPFIYSVSNVILLAQFIKLYTPDINVSQEHIILVREALHDIVECRVDGKHNHLKHAIPTTCLAIARFQRLEHTQIHIIRVEALKYVLKDRSAFIQVPSTDILVIFSYAADMHLDDPFFPPSGDVRADGGVPADSLSSILRY